MISWRNVGWAGNSLALGTAIRVGAPADEEYAQATTADAMQPETSGAAMTDAAGTQVA